MHSRVLPDKVWVCSLNVVLAQQKMQLFRTVMKKLQSILLCAILALSAFPTLSASETSSTIESVLELKPGQREVHIFTIAEGGTYSYTIEQEQVPTIKGIERMAYMTGPRIFRGILLRAEASDSEACNVVDLDSYLEALRQEKEPELLFKNPIEFGKPFQFPKAPSGGTALMIESIDMRALSGMYTVTAEREGRVVAKRRVHIAPEYAEDIAKSIAQARELYAITASAEKALIELKKIDDRSKDRERDILERSQELIKLLEEASRIQE